MGNSHNITDKQSVDQDQQNGLLAASFVPSRVLIVDDEPDIVEEVIEQLDDEGFDCVFAYSADQAIEMVGKDSGIGVIVTDIRMPGMDGLEMARKLKDEAGSLRDLYIIVVTGHAGMAEAIESLQLGAEDFLTKPISPNHLVHSVRRAEEMIQLRSNDRVFQLHLEQQVKAKTSEIRVMADELAEQNTLLEKQNQELAVIGKLKDEFLQMMSHELNTPLNAIVGFAQLMKESLNEAGDTKNEQCANHILAAGNRLAESVDSILTLAEISAGKLEMDLSDFSAQNLVDSLVSENAQILEHQNTKLRSDIPDPSLQIQADYQELKKAIGRLLENAAKYGQKDGAVTISVRSENDQVKFIISDNGPGMTSEQIAMALEPLRQVDGSMARKHEGLGLGLPIAKGIAELHGGSLEIQSAEGAGTIVTISMPDADKTA